MNGVIVHEWIATSGGSEKVLDSMLETFPEEDVLCLWNDNPNRYSHRVLHETWLARTPLRRSKAASLPLMPPTWRSRKEGPYDWALVSSHVFAHQVSFANAPVSFEKFVYVHTPARYIWVPELDGRGSGLLGKLAVPALRAIDKKRAQGPRHLAANSEFVRKRIAKAWELDAEVIYPPVDTTSISSVPSWRSKLSPEENALFSSLPSEFILGASRLVPYKALDVVIHTGKVIDLPVVIAGSGPDLDRLKAIAADSTTPVVFIPSPSDALLYALYETCVMYVFPPVEDFGIMPVEAVAAGAKILVNAQGGAAESASLTRAGSVVHEWQSVSEVRSAFHAAASSVGGGSDSTRQFSRETFQSKIRGWVMQSIEPTSSDRESTR